MSNRRTLIFLLLNLLVVTVYCDNYCTSGNCSLNSNSSVLIKRHAPVYINPATATAAQIQRAQEVRKGIIHWQIPSLQLYSGVAHPQSSFNHRQDDFGLDQYQDEGQGPGYDYEKIQNDINSFVAGDEVKSEINNNYYTGINNYYVNGTDLLTNSAELEQSQSYPSYPTHQNDVSSSASGLGVSVGAGLGDDDESYWPDSLGPTTNLVEDEVLYDNKLEIGSQSTGFKYALIIATMWYLVIAVFFNTQAAQLYQIQKSSPCANAIDKGELELHHLHASNPLIGITVSSSPLQDQIYEMFSPSSYDDDSSEESGLPDISQIGAMCSRNAFFYGLNHNHMQAVNMLTDMFMQMGSPNKMMKMAKSMRRNVNPKVWYSALMRASYSRGDMHGMIIPPPMDAMPDTFIPTQKYYNARSLNVKRARSGKHKKHQKCIRVDGSVGKDNGLENILWYFREDVMVNSHHWYWHMAYPLMNRNGAPDRRGELFYSAHISMTARYNIERLCNGLDIVEAFKVFPGAEIFDGYNPHLTDHNAGMPWTARPPHIPIDDILHQENPEVAMTILIRNWIQSKNRITKSIDSGYFITPKGTMRIPSNHQGIDMLANTIEAIDLSVNPQYYDRDGFHNNGHRILGYAVDPHFHLMLPPGPMADPSTAMRDPIFYRWHTTINKIFERYKFTLAPYAAMGGQHPLLWSGVEIQSVQVFSKTGDNHLKTFWNKKKFELSLGLAFNKTEDEDHDDGLDVCATHLDHHEFKYEIVVDRKKCVKSKSDKATIRIFLAPRYNLHGKRFTIQEQRRLFVHLDLFTVDLPPGRSVITRSSIDSSLTIPFQQSIKQLKVNRENHPNCGCGWPHHLLLPKGTPDGMHFDLFVMVTNGDDDYVEDNPLPHSCGKAFIYCGIPQRRYPDNKPMGYPFDREIPWCSIRGIVGKIVCPILGKKYIFLEDFMYGISNMATREVIITHKD